MKKYEHLLEIYAEKIAYLPFHLSSNLRLFYILRGSMDCRWVAGAQTFSAGEIEIVNINEPFCVEQASEDNLTLWFEIDGEKAVSFYDLIDDGLYNCNTTLFYDSKTDAAKQESLKDKLRELYRHCAAEAEQSVIEEYVRGVVGFVGENCHDLLNMLNARRGTPRADRFFRIYTYIYNHCTEKINLKQLADREYVSQQYLSKEFNERLNMNFKDTLEYYRIIAAVRYLITTDKTITMISDLCGFSAPRYFYKHFGLYLKCTPMEFRAKYLGGQEQLQRLSGQEDETLPLLMERLELRGGHSEVQVTASEMRFVTEFGNAVHYNKRKVPQKLMRALLAEVRPKLPPQVEVMEIPSYGTKSSIAALLVNASSGEASSVREEVSAGETLPAGEVPPVILLFYTRDISFGAAGGLHTSAAAGTANAAGLSNGAERFAVMAGETGLLACAMCRLAESKGLRCHINFSVIPRSGELRKILGADEALQPLLAVEMGYAI